MVTYFLTRLKHGDLLFNLLKTWWPIFFLTCLKHGDFFLACLKQGPSLLHCQHIPCLVGVSIDTYCSQTPQMSFWLHSSILLFFLFWVTALARCMGCFSHRSLSPSWNLKPFSSLLCVSCTSDLSVGQPTRSIQSFLVIRLTLNHSFWEGNRGNGAEF